MVCHARIWHIRHAMQHLTRSHTWYAMHSHLCSHAAELALLQSTNRPQLTQHKRPAHCPTAQQVGVRRHSSSTVVPDLVPVPDLVQPPCEKLAILSLTCHFGPLRRCCQSGSCMVGGHRQLEDAGGLTAKSVLTSKSAPVISAT